MARIRRTSSGSQPAAQTPVNEAPAASGSATAPEYLVPLGAHPLPRVPRSSTLSLMAQRSLLSPLSHLAESMPGRLSPVGPLSWSSERNGYDTNFQEHLAGDMRTEFHLPPALAQEALSSAFDGESSESQLPPPSPPSHHAQTPTSGGSSPAPSEAASNPST
jgi:hypothetical protein